MSRTQLSFLHALLDGHQAYNGRDILDAYHLGSSANASKLKRVMQEKELAQLNRGGELEFVDPVLEEWLRRRGRWGAFAKPKMPELPTSRVSSSGTYRGPDARMWGG